MKIEPSRREFVMAAAAATASTLSMHGALAQSRADVPDDWAYRTATELLAALAATQISSVELVDFSIARIEALDKRLNAVVVRDFERARAAAKAADAALARGERRPLLGLPMTVKESFGVVGLPTTWGNPVFKGWHPSVDALAVTRLKAAGAVVLGKTNVPISLSDWQSYNEVYGTTNNPWDLGRTPGGSSGGSAAALAAGLVPLELGSDIGGSLRAPAHYCGVFSHKPTLDLVPLRGAGPPGTPPASGRVDLAVAGPMARSAADLALELDVLAGPDELWEGIGYKLSLPPPRHADLKSFRVLLIDTHPLFPTAASVRAALDRLAQRLGKSGCSVARASPLLPDLAANARMHVQLLAAFFAADLPVERRRSLEEAARALPADDDSLMASRLRGTSLSHRDWLMTARLRAGQRERWRNLLTEFDVVLCPPMPTPAFPHDHNEDRRARQLEVDGRQVPYFDQVVWAGPATLLGLPATTAPIDHTDTGLPIGVQIIGGYLEDRTTIAFAGLIEREFGGFVPPPMP
jgi:amidase